MPNSPVCWTDTSQPVIVSFVTKSDWPILTSSYDNGRFGWV